VLLRQSLGDGAGVAAYVIQARNRAIVVWRRSPQRNRRTLESLGYSWLAEVRLVGAYKQGVRIWIFSGVQSAPCYLSQGSGWCALSATQKRRCRRRMPSRALWQRVPFVGT
jgi:hypothetical protein